MKVMKHVKMRGLCLAGLCVMSVLAFGMTGTASASILFLPLSHKFPYHMAGVGGKSVLETVGGGVENRVESEHVDVLLLALSPTLADVHLNFLQSVAAGGLAKCSNVTGQSETILINLLAHIGLADPGHRSAVLMLVPSGFKFVCTPIIGGAKTVLVKGSVIGTIESPATGVPSLLLGVTFNQTAGNQEFTTFLLGSETLLNQTEETSLSEGAFERSGQKSEFTLLHALPGEGDFLLILP